MSQTNAETVQDTPLTIREHLDPDKHWIGETLAPPTQSEIAGTVGTISGPGDSPFVARADHTHKIDPNLLYVDLVWSPTVTGITKGTGFSETARAFSLRVSPTLRLITASYNLQLGTGGNVTGDTTVPLPVTASNRFVGYGYAECSNRSPLTWMTLGANQLGALVRPHTYNPTLTGTTQGVNIGTIALSALGTWASGDYISLFGQYYTTY